jgi:hypothetical protein
MVRDGLYERHGVPKPDFLFALHLQRGRSRTGWTTETLHEAVLKERE